MPDEDDRPRDTGAERGAAGAAGSGSTSEPVEGRGSWADLVVPDDISSLSEDVAAYYRERRAARRRATATRLLSPRGVRPALLISAVLLLAGTVTTLLTVLSPQLREPAPSQAPVATQVGTPGQPGSRIPNVALTSPDGRHTTALSLRPAVVILLPSHCDCAPRIEGLAQQASSINYTLDLVVPSAPGTDSQAASLTGQLHAGRAALWYDAKGALANAFATNGALTVVLLRDDGLVFDRLVDPPPGSRQLDNELQRLDAPEVSG
jgi:hypothetical protein